LTDQKPTKTVKFVPDGHAGEMVKTKGALRGDAGEVLGGSTGVRGFTQERGARYQREWGIRWGLRTGETRERRSEKRENM